MHFSVNSNHLKEQIVHDKCFLTPLANNFLFHYVGLDYDPRCEQMHNLLSKFAFLLSTIILVKLTNTGLSILFVLLMLIPMQ